MSTTIRDEILADSPDGFWDFQDASGNIVAYGSSGADIDTFTGTVDYHQTGPATGYSDYSVKFDAGEKCSSSSGNAMLGITANFTLEIWANLTVLSNNFAICEYGTPGADGYGFLTTTAHKLRGVCHGVALLGDSSASIDSGWHQLVMRRGGGGVWQYLIDGVLDNANAGNSTPNTPIGSIKIFRDTTDAGYIAYAACWQSLLTDDDIARHYAAATGDVGGGFAPGQVILID